MNIKKISITLLVILAVVIVRPVISAITPEEYSKFCSDILASGQDYSVMFKDKNTGFLGEKYYKMLDGVSLGIESCFKLAVDFGDRADGYQATEQPDAFTNLLDRDQSAFVAYINKYPLPENLLVQIFSNTDMYYSIDKTSNLEEIFNHRIIAAGKIKISQKAREEIISSLNHELDYYKNEYVLKEYEHVDSSGDFRVGFRSSLKYLVSGNSSYVLANLFDNNLDTAWCEGEIGSGENANLHANLYIDEKYKHGYQLSGVWINIGNGYLKTNSSYSNNARYKSLEIELRSNNYKVKKIIQVEFEDVFNKSINKVFIPINENLDELGSNLLINIKPIGIYKGEKYEDLCVSELNLIPEIKKIQ